MYYITTHGMYQNISPKSSLLMQRLGNKVKYLIFFPPHTLRLNIVDIVGMIICALTKILPSFGINNNQL